MAHYKATFVFELHQHGWTESYHTDNEVVGLAQILVLADNLAKARAELLGKEAILKAIRVSSEDEKNDALLRYVNYKGIGIGDNPAVAPPECDDPDTAVQVRCENVFGNRHKLIYLRGIWDDINIEGGKLKKIDLVWNTRFDFFAGKLKADWGWWGVDAQPKRTQVITGYTVSPEGIVTITTGGDFFQAGEIGPDKFVKARISRLNRSQSELSGEVILNPLTATTAKTVSTYGLYPFSSNGRIVISGYRVWDMATVIQQKIVTRRAGAPLLESRGRAKKRSRG